jgi:hypothetical protein
MEIGETTAADARTIAVSGLLSYFSAVAATEMAAAS